MMKFLILACLVLSAVAEPEPQHETVGFTKHLMVLSFPSTPPASSNKRLSMVLPTLPQLSMASSSLSTLDPLSWPPQLSRLWNKWKKGRLSHTPWKKRRLSHTPTPSLMDFNTHTRMDFTIPSLMELIIPLIPLTEFIILARERPRLRLKLTLLSSTLITMATPTPLMATPASLATLATPTPLMLPTPTPTKCH